LALLTIGIGGGLWYTGQNGDSDQTLTLFGNIDIRQVQLAFNGNQRIAEILVQEGDRVEKGRLLARLETRRLEAAAAARQARVAAQKQVVARMEAGTRPEEIRQARAEKEKAEAEARLAELTYNRVKDLAQRKIVSPQEEDDAEAAYEAAQARLNAANETLELAIAGPRKEDIAAAQATLEAYKAELDLANRELEDANLYAPSNGVIENRILEPGDMASPQNPVLTLALTDPLWVRAYVSETDLGKIRHGMKAYVITDSFPEKRYDGWIGFISPTAEFTPKSVQTREVRTKLVYQVRVFARNPQGELRLGMPAEVVVPLNQSKTTEPNRAPGFGAESGAGSDSGS
jgi:HlyD family secretion protein